MMFDMIDRMAQAILGPAHPPECRLCGGSGSVRVVVVAGDDNRLHTLGDPRHGDTLPAVPCWPCHGTGIEPPSDRHDDPRIP